MLCHLAVLLNTFKFNLTGVNVIIKKLFIFTKPDGHDKNVSKI